VKHLDDTKLPIKLTRRKREINEEKKEIVKRKIYAF